MATARQCRRSPLLVFEHKHRRCCLVRELSSSLDHEGVAGEALHMCRSLLEDSAPTTTSNKWTASVVGSTNRRPSKLPSS